MKKKEVLIIIAIILMCGIIFLTNKFLNKNKQMVQVQNQYGDVLLEFPLNEDGEYSIHGANGYMYIEVKDGQYHAHDVDCPDKVCESVGWVSADNYMPIVCLPNGLMVVLADE